MALRKMRIRAVAATPLVALVALAAAWCAPAAASASLSPLPPSDYTVRAACAAPAPGSAACMALTLVPATEAARARTHPLASTRSSAGPARSAAAGAYGLTPQALHSAYALPASPAAAQTIALVDAYNDPTAEADLNAYEREFGLPECTAASGCFEQLNQYGESGNPPFPRSTEELEAARAGTKAQREEAAAARGWELETSLDIEAARAVCETCRIVLVAANSASDEDLNSAENAAVAAGAGEISNSWGGAEIGQWSLEAPFNHPGVLITASAGDSGYLDWAGTHPGYADFPASSPHVVAVGGTRLLLSGTTWAGETVWNGNGAGGGGCSTEFSAPQWQSQLSDWPRVGCGEFRSVADVSAVADPYTGLAVRSSNACPEAGAQWCTVGGTSLSSPVIAATFALAGGAGGVPYPARTLYENAGRNPGSLHDVVEGSNGECLEPLAPQETSGCSAEREAQASCASRLGSCLAGVGYDGPSGLGSPRGLGAFAVDGQAGAEPEARSPASGAGSAAAPTPSVAPVSGASAPPPAPPPAAPAPARITGLALSARAMVAVRRSGARRAQVAFVFSLSAPASVRVALYRRVRVHGHLRWVALASSQVLAARGGRNGAHLIGTRRLAPGGYRLALTTRSGARRSIVFAVR